jgi:DNA-binding transcriptional regulator/RsmH inhibitor MraZ
MFCSGTWVYHTDERGRVKIPRIFRRDNERRKGRVFILKRDSLCLYLKKEKWMNPQDIYIVYIDAENRILIPKELRETFPNLNHVSEEIKWAGRGNHFELLIKDKISV